MSGKISFVLFDLDGTLTDSAVGIISSFRHVLNGYGIDADESEIRKCIGPPLIEGLASFGIPPDRRAEAVTAYREYFSITGIFENTLYPGVTEMLASIADAGIVIGLATSKLTEYAVRILDHFRIAENFEVVAGATRDGSRLHKDDIVGFALGELGRPDAACGAMVGDREHDIYAAVSHGLRPLAVGWGYGGTDELIGAGAPGIIASPADLAALILSGSGSGGYLGAKR